MSPEYQSTALNYLHKAEVDATATGDVEQVKLAKRQNDIWNRLYGPNRDPNYVPYHQERGNNPSDRGTGLLGVLRGAGQITKENLLRLRAENDISALGEDGPRAYAIDTSTNPPTYTVTVHFAQNTTTIPITRELYESEYYPQLGPTVKPEDRPKADVVAPPAPDPLANPLMQRPVYGSPGAGYSAGVSASQNPLLYAQPGTPGGPQAATQVDTGAIDSLFSDLDQTTAQIQAIGTDAGANQLANQQARHQAELDAAHAMGLARSGRRGYGSTALLQQGQAETGAVYSDLSQTQSVLRAQQEDNQRRLKLDLANTVGQLGLDKAGLEFDIANVDLGATTANLNNLFADQGLKLRLDEQRSQAVLNFLQSMQFASLDLADMNEVTQNATAIRLAERAGLREEERLAVMQAAKAHQQNKEANAQQGIGGAVTAIAAIAMSDRREKTAITDTTEADLAELVAAVRPAMYDYIDEKHGKGRQFGLMAQDLQKSGVGQGMVIESPDGKLMVHGGKAGIAALSGMALLHDRLDRLERALR